MVPVMSISKGAAQAARHLAGPGLLLGLGIPGACLIAFAIFGLTLHPLMGSAAWQPFHEFTGGLIPAATAPTAIGAFLLPALFLALATVASFSYWCRLQASLGESRNIVNLLLSAAWRLLRLALSPFLPASRVSTDLAGQALPLYLPERTLTSTPADFSGALPLLE